MPNAIQWTDNDPANYSRAHGFVPRKKPEPLAPKIAAAQLKARRKADRETWLAADKANGGPGDQAGA